MLYPKTYKVNREKSSELPQRTGTTPDLFCGALISWLLPKDQALKQQSKYNSFCNLDKPCKVSIKFLYQHNAA